MPWIRGSLLTRERLSKQGSSRCLDSLCTKRNQSYRRSPYDARYIRCMSLFTLRDWLMIASKVCCNKDARGSCVYSDVISYSNSPATFYRKSVRRNCDGRRLLYPWSNTVFTLSSSLIARWIVHSGNNRFNGKREHVEGHLRSRINPIKD